MQALADQDSRDRGAHCLIENVYRRSDLLVLVLALTAVSAASSSYTAYKTYLMTDGKAVPKRR